MRNKEKGVSLKVIDTDDAGLGVVAELTSQARSDIEKLPAGSFVCVGYYKQEKMNAIQLVLSTPYEFFRQFELDKDNILCPLDFLVKAGDVGNDKVSMANCETHFPLAILHPSIDGTLKLYAPKEYILSGEELRYAYSNLNSYLEFSYDFFPSDNALDFFIKWLGSSDLISECKAVSDKPKHSIEHIYFAYRYSVIVNSCLVRKYLDAYFSDNQGVKKFFEYLDQLINKQEKSIEEKKAFARMQMHPNFIQLVLDRKWNNLWEWTYEPVTGFSFSDADRLLMTMLNIMIENILLFKQDVNVKSKIDLTTKPGVETFCGFASRLMKEFDVLSHNPERCFDGAIYTPNLFKLLIKLLHDIDDKYIKSFNLFDICEELKLKLKKCVWSASENEKNKPSHPGVDGQYLKLLDIYYGNKKNTVIGCNLQVKQTEFTYNLKVPLGFFPLSFFDFRLEEPRKPKKSSSIKSGFLL